MEFPKVMLAFFFISSLFRGTMANEYEVGGSEGWSATIRSWSSGRTFEVGDVLIFSYDSNIDSVLQVKREDYRLCFSLAPLATYRTGRDTVPLNDPEEMYFISGNAQNCLAGEKLHIKVSDDSGSSRDPYNPYSPSGYPNRNASTTLSSTSKCLTVAVLGLILHVLLLPFSKFLNLSKKV